MGRILGFYEPHRIVSDAIFAIFSEENYRYLLSIASHDYYDLSGNRGSSQPYDEQAIMNRAPREFLLSIGGFRTSRAVTKNDNCI